MCKLYWITSKCSICSFNHKSTAFNSLSTWLNACNTSEVSLIFELFIFNLLLLFIVVVLLVEVEVVEVELFILLLLFVVFVVKSISSHCNKKSIISSFNCSDCFDKFSCKFIFFVLLLLFKGTIAEPQFNSSNKVSASISSLLK